MLPEELVSRVRDGYAVPLVGSGISRRSGVASWNELVGRLRKSVEGWLGRKVEDEELDLLEAPLLYSHLHESRQPLYDLLREAVGPDFLPNPLHVQIAQMPFRTVLTTNWDTLLEDAMRPQRPVNVIFDDRGVSTWRESKATQVIKVHGTIESPDSIVFGEDDYQRFYSGESLLLQLVRTILATRSIVALGFGMRDSYVKMLFSQVARLAGKTSNPHYVVVPEVDSARLRAEYLRSAGFVVVPVLTSTDDPYGVARFLGELHAQTYIYATERVDRTRMLVRETARLRDYLGPDRTVRVRATMGPFAVPDYLGDPAGQETVFGKREVFDAEWELRELCLALAAENDVRIRMIGNPVDRSWIVGKGYSEQVFTDRVKAFVDAARRLGDKFEFAPSVRPSDANTWIVSTLSLIDSAKASAAEQRLYDRAVLETESDRVRRAVTWFDEEFESLAARAGGVNRARDSLLQEMSALLAT